MRTKTVVELTEKEVVDAMIAKAKESVKHVGSINVHFTDADKMSIQTPTVEVVFECAVK